MKVLVEFSGGLELMFEGKKHIDVDLPETHTTLENLVDFLKKHNLKDKEEMFVQGSSVRPGIIVLVNDTDWELLDTLHYKIQERDQIAFISTLHGG
eukprot:403358408